MGKKKKLNEFQYKELMQAEKLAAPMIAQVKADLRKQCLEDQLNLETVMVSQAFSLYFWILHDKFQWGNKRLSALLDECMDSLSGLGKKIAEAECDYVEFVSNWFDEIEEELGLAVRAIKEEEDLSMIFGGESKYADVVEGIPWKRTEWNEENTLSDDALEELRSNSRHVNRAKTIMEQYRIEAQQRLLRMYSSDSSRDCRTVQNIVLATICIKLHESFGFGNSRLVKVIGYMDELAKCFASRFDNRSGAYISIEDIMMQLEEETKVNLPGIKEKIPFRIGQYVIDLSDEGEVIWRKAE